MARRGWLLLLLACACFQDQPTSGADGSSTGDACMPGEVLCPCRDGECNEGLQCVPEGCIPDDCDPGTPTCTCYQPGDACIEGWECASGLCQPVGSATTGMTTTPPTSVTSDSMTSVGPMSTGAMDTGDITGLSAMTTASSLDTSDTMPMCDAPASCLECMMCAVEDECASASFDCGADPNGCSTTYGCIVDCIQGPRELISTCFDECQCNGNMPLQGLVGCIESACDQCPPLPCGP